VTDETHEMWVIRIKALVYRVEEDILARSWGLAYQSLECSLYSSSNKDARSL
jgi:hypothetical protein